MQDLGSQVLFLLGRELQKRRKEKRWHLYRIARTFIRVLLV